jgi:hypothetical protein
MTLFFLLATFMATFMIAEYWYKKSQSIFEAIAVFLAIEVSLVFLLEVFVLK